MEIRQKLRREISRVIGQVRSTPAHLLESAFSTYWNDHVLSRQKVVTQGTADPSDKIAIYLIFPTDGVLESHLESLHYIRSRGYAPVVVSNLFITEADRRKLEATSHLAIERNNFGYDFGGYREGILSIAGELPDISRLVLLNDSCWFPLPGSQDWLGLAEASGLDCVGASSNYGTDRPGIDLLHEFDWRYETTHPGFHYCSFALSLSSKIVRDPEFLRFWRGYRMSNDKLVTIRRGEIGLTQWAIGRGHSHGSTANIDRLDRDLSALDGAQIKRIADELIIPENNTLSEAVQRLVDDAGSATIQRQTLEKVILAAVASQGMAYSIPYYLHTFQGYAFLKKSPLRLNALAAIKTLKLIEGLGEAGETMRIEAQRIYTEAHQSP